jgi:hypothetical protein
MTPLWPSELTAWGTLAVAIVAVAVALFAEWRASVRVMDERENAAKVLADERGAADERLSRQLAESAAQLQAERDLARDREQLAEAYLVQVTPMRIDPAAYGSQITTTDQTDPITCPSVAVVNNGHFTITEVHAMHSPEGSSVTGYDRPEHLSAYGRLPALLSAGTSGRPEPDAGRRILTPSDIGIRFTRDAVAASKIHGSYPIVRWTDWRGQRWEHKLGQVRKIAADEPWKA